MGTSHWCVLFLVIYMATTSSEFLEGEREHKTAQASVRANDLWCYACDTMEVGERCSNLSLGNNSKLVHKCPESEVLCMVKRYSYTTSTENSTSVLRTWSLERNCTSRCEPGCIIIGERTKLYACTTCCEKSLCNTGRGAGNAVYQPTRVVTLLMVTVVFHLVSFVLIRFHNPIIQIHSIKTTM